MALILSLVAGELLQVVGDNNAGEASLLRILCGLARLKNGVVSWQGQSLAEVRESFHRQLLWLGRKPGINATLTADEDLRFLFPVSRLQRRESVPAAAGLTGYGDLLLSRLSAGQQRRMALTRLWSTGVPLRILDEPFTAPDAMVMETLTCRPEQRTQQGENVALTAYQPLWSLHCPLRTLRLGGDARGGQ